MMNISHQRSVKTYVVEVIALIATAIIYSFAFPGFLSTSGFGFIAFFALIPLFAIIKRTSWKSIAFYGFIFGFAFYTCFNYWLTTFHPLAILLVPIIKGGEMVILFPLLKAASSLDKKRGYLLQAIIWVAYAYLSQSWFAGYPYGTIAYAMYQYLPFIQIASFSGIWILTFLLIVPQSFIGAYLADSSHITPASFSAYLKKNRLFVIIFSVAFAAIWIYGVFSLSHWKKEEPQQTWRVATVQHSADSWKGGYTTYKRNFNTLRTLSLEALREDPDMIIWSETAFVPSVAWHTTYRPNEETADLVEEFIEFGKSLPVPLLTGNPEGVLDDETLPPVLADGEWNRKDYNTVIMFENGEIKKTYRKQHLVPFTEHFPYEKQLPWLYNLLLANDYNWWETGYDPVVFETDSGVHFSTPICFEDVFGYLSAGFVRNGADVIVNMTNDSWSGAVSAEMQHFAMAVFRSVETRKSTIRGTNSGITALIMPSGKVIDPMEPFTKGWNIYDVPVYSDGPDTLYTTYVDILAQSSIYISLVWLIWLSAAAVYKKIKE
ncbi:MAG: apolipoprotein N-acyltransferase [Sphaerochaetaceae bacterium]|nr:apolipoprotein N-acyltransferase [Sphaerochaetaceae bacterium]MDC7246796.1 apolipoprotein N-acyltransferase [Sphaerochaetaceae bacterium]